MFKNYFTVAFRNFGRNKFFSIINIAGLAIGISASLVIFLIVAHEFSYENFQPNKDRIYRVVTNMHFPDTDFKNSGVPGPLPDAVRREVPGIEKSTSFWAVDQIKVSIPNANGEMKTFRKQEHVIFADEGYFSFIPYKWIAGSKFNALSGANKVVLTESRARSYFPGTDVAQAIGKTVTYNDTLQATVTGIVKDLDETTGFTYEEFASLNTIMPQLKANNGYGEWGSISSSYQFFIQVQPGTDSAKLNRALAAARKKHEKDAYLKTDHFVQPLSDIHFNADYFGLGGRSGHKPTLYGLMAVALFLLLLGCINFINLTTAQASQRAKEIGIRKTMGSSRKSLVFQFLNETFLLTVLATLLSLALVPGILNIFSEFIPKDLTFNAVGQWNVIAFIVALILVVSVLAGFYPAMVLSRYKPVSVLKNAIHAGSAQSRKAWLRKTLTVTQFVVAQFFIIATLVVGKQIRFSINKDMGFKKEAIINFDVPSLDYKNPDNKQFVLQQKLQHIPGIQQLSLAGGAPATPFYNINTMKFKKDGKEIETTVETKNADTNYIKLYGLKLIAGRNLHQSDTVREYIVNEAFARFMGYKNPADIVGQVIDPGGNNRPIVGVVADFNTRSVHSIIKPMALSCQQKYHSYFHIALPAKGANTNSWKATIQNIEKEWKTVYPEEPFEYKFFDESIAQFYEKEQKTASLLGWSTGLAIFISCLGLLGLITYTTHQRTKEIGVRKVLGASVTQIIALLSKDFIRLIVIAFVISVPLAWWAMHNWLNDFAYRTEISWWVFAACGAMIILVALMIIVAKTIRAALDNPVKSLRTE